MSRIHEALKKAEQERAATQQEAGALASDHSANEVGIAVMPAKQGDTEIYPERPSNLNVLPTAENPPFSTPFGIEALSRCVRQPWVPDEKTMLFFNGDDGVRGTEEFRTLRSRLYHAREKMPLKKVLVTSALPKEGKSFTASNLAQVLVRQPLRARRTRRRLTRR